MSFLTLSQKKWDTILPVKHNHYLFFDFIYDDDPSTTWNTGYEYWYRSRLVGVTTFVGFGVLPTYRGEKFGAIHHSKIGVHLTIGKWMGLKIGANIVGRINPKAYTGFYNDGGELLSYPLSIIDSYKVPGDPVLKWETQIKFDIGAYFTVKRGLFYFYPHFSLMALWRESYWYQPRMFSHGWRRLFGMVFNWNIGAIHERTKEIRLENRNKRNLK